MNGIGRSCLVLSLLFAACGGESQLGTAVDSTIEKDERSADTTAMTAPPDTSSVDAAPETTAPQDTATTDTDPQPGCEPGEGCFGESCTGNDDCLSGICAMHLGDYVCSKSCDASCPAGWTCKLVGGVGDGGYACVSDTSHLCLPCASSAECVNESSVNACVSYGESYLYSSKE